MMWPFKSNTKMGYDLVTTDMCAREYAELYVMNGHVTSPEHVNAILREGKRIFSDMDKYGYDTALSLEDFSKIHIKPLVPKKQYRLLSYNLICECEWAMVNYGKDAFCCNPHCEHFNVKYKRPSVQLERSK